MIKNNGIKYNGLHNYQGSSGHSLTTKVMLDLTHLGEFSAHICLLSLKVGSWILFRSPGQCKRLN